MLVVNLFSPDGRYDQLYLSNYATIQSATSWPRIDGVGDVSFLGQQDYSMRVWLEPGHSSASRNLTAGDVVAACASRTCRWRPGRSASRRCPAGRISNMRSPPAAA